MRRVLVIGCPGAGKSTFARRLRDATGLPLYYLDMLWHKPDRTTITREEFDIRLQMILEQDEWIIDGNFARTLPMRLAYCDTVFFLDFPTGVCLEGVERRIGIKHEDMPWVEHEFDEEFRRYNDALIRHGIIKKKKKMYPEFFTWLKERWGDVV